MGVHAVEHKVAAGSTGRRIFNDCYHRHAYLIFTATNSSTEDYVSSKNAIHEIASMLDEEYSLAPTRS